METLTTTIALLLVLSIASERLVEIVKGMFSFLNDKNDNPRNERWRRVILQALAVVAGILTAFMARPAITEIIPETGQSITGVIALGFLASGGSGLWNVILTWLLQVKEIRSETAEALGKLKQQNVAPETILQVLKK